MAAPVSVRFAPGHNKVGLATAETPVGAVAFTTREAEVAVTVKHEFEALRVYTPAFAAITPVTPVVNDVGLAIAVPPGRVHAYVVAPVAVPVSVRLPAVHIGLGEAVAVTPVGGPVTVTVTSGENFGAGLFVPPADVT